jgi:hypothetical protein
VSHEIAPKARIVTKPPTSHETALPIPSYEAAVCAGALVNHESRRYSTSAKGLGEYIHFVWEK